MQMFLRQGQVPAPGGSSENAAAKNLPLSAHSAHVLVTSPVTQGLKGWSLVPQLIRDGSMKTVQSGSQTERKGRPCNLEGCGPLGSVLVSIVRSSLLQNS